MTDEEWRPIAGHEGYSVSSYGRVKWRTRLRKQTADAKGYLRVNLWVDNKSKGFAVAGLVANAFCGQRPNGQVVRHRNGVNSDNRAENLHYGTQKENEEDKCTHGTKAQGVSHGAAKLTEAQVLDIRQRYVARDKNNHIRALAVEFGVSTKTVHSVILRRTWRHI